MKNMPNGQLLIVKTTFSQKHQTGADGRCRQLCLIGLVPSHSFSFVLTKAGWSLAIRNIAFRKGRRQLKCVSHAALKRGSRPMSSLKL